MKTITTKLMIALLISAVSIVPANAQSQEHFSHQTPRTPQRTAPAAITGPAERESLTRGMVIAGPRTPVVTWFELLDESVETLKVSDQDRMNLKRPINREAERVQDWINTATRVIKNYRTLATTIRRMAIPLDAVPELKQYRDSKANWYGDVADLYEELIVPRTPPKTQEELDGQIAEIQSKTVALDSMRRQLEEMDTKIRIACGVHGNKNSDSLVQYVLHKPAPK